MEHAMPTIQFIAALLFGFGCYLLGSFRKFDALRAECNQLYEQKHNALAWAEEYRKENWSLRQALGHEPVCDICGDKATVGISGQNGSANLCEFHWQQYESVQESEHE